MTRGKTPGPDDITSDFLKDLDDANLTAIQQLIAEWWDSGNIPEDLFVARVASLYKKGDPDIQENYRPISLLSSFYKLLAASLQTKLADAIDDRLIQIQFGFRKGKSTTDALFIARRVQEYAERAGLPGLMLLLDWEKAFDKIRHTWLLQAMASSNVPAELMQILEGLYTNPKFFVEVEGVRSEEAKQSTGIRQGCPLSPYLFIMVMDCIFEIVPYIANNLSRQMFNLKGNDKPIENIEGMNLSYHALLFADDTLLVTAAGHSMDALLWAVEAVSGVFRIKKLNRGKCQKISVRPTNHIEFRDGTKVETSSKAEYLGSRLSSKVDPMMEINKRIAGAAYVRRRLEDFRKRGFISKRGKLLICETLVGTKLVYALHTMPITDVAFNQIDSCYFKGLGTILGLDTTFGQMQKGEEWTNTNQLLIDTVNAELQKGRCKKEFKKISDRIKNKSRALLGNVLRRPEGDPLQETLVADEIFNLPEVCRVGRTRANWVIKTAHDV